ncbi:MAG: hypothetical protein P8Y97_19375, partial [Candidatus Lokiarchaeota archaeon]
MSTLEKEKIDMQNRLSELNKNNELHLDTITNLKIQLKAHRDKVKSNDEKGKIISDEVINLKKELKVIRRERDH